MEREKSRMARGFRQVGNFPVYLLVFTDFLTFFLVSLLSRVFFFLRFLFTRRFTYRLSFIRSQSYGVTLLLVQSADYATVLFFFSSYMLPLPFVTFNSKLRLGYISLLTLFLSQKRPHLGYTLSFSTIVCSIVSYFIQKLKIHYFIPYETEFYWLEVIKL